MRIFNNLRNWALGLTAGAILSTYINLSCSKSVEPTTNTPPNLSLNVTPSSGNSPLQVRVRGEVTDPDGSQDIASYRTVVKNNANPDSMILRQDTNYFDTTLTLTCPPWRENVVYNFKSEAVDKGGARVEKKAAVTVNKKPNNAPNVTLNVPVTSGRAPLSVPIHAEATDPDSIGDIINYGVVFQQANGLRDTLRSNPLDTTIIFNYPVLISAYARDKSGAEDRKAINVNVRRPSLTHSTTLDDLVNILYSATFSDLDSATLSVTKNNQTIISKKIRPSVGQSYVERFSYSTDTSITKGNYVFIARWTNPEGTDTSTATTITIPQYPFSINLTNFDFEEEADVTKNLPNPAYINPEDNPAVWTSATSTDGKTTPELNGNQLRIIGNEDRIGNYNIRIGVRSNTGRNDFASQQGNIIDMLDIHGFLEDNENHQRQAGRIRVYNSNRFLLGEISVPVSGEFRAQLPHRVSSLTENIFIQGRKIVGQDVLSFIRTMKFPRGDRRNIEMRVVPYAPYTNNYGEFEQFMFELAGLEPHRFDFYGEYLRGLPGFENFIGLERIRILNHGYFSDSLSVFTPEQQNFMRNKILDINDISGIIGDYRIDPSKIVFGNDPSFSDYTPRVISPPDPLLGDWNIIPKKGVIVVTPKTGMGSAAGVAAPFGISLLTWGGVIYLLPYAGSNGTITSHEFGHIFIGGGHPTSLPLDQSVMRLLPVITTTGPADKKAGKIIYERNFMTFPPSSYPRLDNLDNILGQSWGFWR